MEWVGKLLELAISLFRSRRCDKPGPYKVNRKWIEIERDQVDDGLKKKHGDNGQ
jgi:hypothetical protein